MIGALTPANEKAGGQPGNFSATTTKRIADAATIRDAEKRFSTWKARTAFFELIGVKV